MKICRTCKTNKAMSNGYCGKCCHARYYVSKKDRRMKWDDTDIDKHWCHELSAPMLRVSLV